MARGGAFFPAPNRVSLGVSFRSFSDLAEIGIVYLGLIAMPV